MYWKRRYERWQSLRKYVLLRDGYVCHYCRLKLTVEVSVDHILPRSAGGQDIAKNLVACCLKCNKNKGSISYESYVERIAA